MNNDICLKEATYFLSDNIRYPLNAINSTNDLLISEVRIKRSWPVSVIANNERYFLKYDGLLTKNIESGSLCIADAEDFDESVRKLCNYSLHSYQNELINGFITIGGGHRVGICATAVKNSKGEIVSVKNISSMNIRISRDIRGVSDKIINSIFSNGIKSILIVGEPSSGKTTLLRDIATKLSGKEFGFLRVSIIDERSEIAQTGTFLERKNLDIGCDIFDAYPKSQGMMTALRSMGPDVIICDEIGKDEDVVAIENISNSGVNIIASIHSSSLGELLRKPQFNKLIRTASFETAIFLKGKISPGEISDIVSLRRFWK